MPVLLRLIVLGCFLAALPNLAAPAARDAEILWDRYGVPHIYASSLEGVTRAHGWAQMRNHADLLLRLYAQGRGRAAEYLGPQWVESDRWVHTHSVPERARQWHAQQTPEFRRTLDAFAAGINAYGQKHSDRIAPLLRPVLPVTGVDVLAHTMRVVHFAYMGSPAKVTAALSRQRNAVAGDGPPPDDQATPGSNTWAIGPKRSASGKALLLINPHLAWEDYFTYMEVHLNGPGLSLYGAPQVGFPMPVVGFNEHGGWSRTVNTIDTVDLYRLTPEGSGYRFDGDVRRFEEETRTLKVRQADGTLRSEPLRIRRSVHGPVVYDQGGVVLAMRVAGLDRPRMLEQWFRMGTARTVEEFQAALRMQHIPMWNAVWADRNGRILAVCNGLVPRRAEGDWASWSGIVPGDTSKTLWTGYLSVDELPQVQDPSSGFVQNANEPPWSMTDPPLDAARYPAYLAPKERLSFRSRRSLRMVTEDSQITLDDLARYKHSTRVELADAILDELLTATRARQTPQARRAAEVLAKWDRQTEASSRGAVLFAEFAARLLDERQPFTTPLRVAAPLAPMRLRDPALAAALLEDAATQVQAFYGTLDVPWGDVFRFRRGNADLPANGGFGPMGIFRTMTFGPPEANGRRYPTHGDTFFCAVEFAQPVQARCLLGYGNASQPGSKHIEDQLPLLSRKELRSVWRTRAEIEANLEERERP